MPLRQRNLCQVACHSRGATSFRGARDHRGVPRCDPMQDGAPDELLELLRKYEEMLGMRLADEAHPGGDPRREMAALAARFPGSLRELDELPMQAIRGRIEELSRCIAEGRHPAPWMRATALFHRLTRGALAAKRWLGARRSIDAELAGAFLDEIERSVLVEDARAWASDLARIAAPPRGKLTDMVFERIAQEMSVPIDEARRLVVGTPRRLRRP
jgi:hypothetical protein